MLGRRRFLGAGLAGAAGLALPGCALVPPAAPTLAPSPASTPLPGQSALATLRADLESATAVPWPDPHAGLLAWALGVTADQCAAVSVPVASPGAGPSEQRPEAPDAAALSALHGALLTAGEAFSAQALAGTAAHPLLWAAMTAWTRATAAQFDDPTAHREPARSVLDAAEQAPDAALQAALDALGEAVHGIELAAGTPGLGADEVAAARARIDAWFGHRDALTDALGPTPTPVPTPAAPWFEVPRPGEPTQARALIARVEAATMPILGRAFAFGPNATRPPLLEALADAATDVPRWGGLVERWPGLPVS
ncbi:MAG: hypothetical protein L0G22_09995 [Propionibacteriaceae bacterium]|nr:hypothetical protein [Propionibacteriaceae bacterium]